MSEPNPHPNCRLPSCSNANEFLRCPNCHSVWYCSLPHARNDSSRHREECYAAILERERRLTSLARNFLYTFVGYFSYQRWYLKRYSWKAPSSISHGPRSHWEVGNPSDDRHVVTQSNQDRWEINIDRLTVVWDLVRMGGTLSVPLPIALLQLPTAFGNTMLRTLVILAFLLAISSLVSASFFIASKERLTSAGKREKWIDASICPKFFPSIDFWLCLSWPVTSFVWSITLSLVAIVSLATINQPDPTSVGVQNSDVAHFVTIIVVTLIFVISYRIFKFLSATKN